VSLVAQAAQYLVEHFGGYFAAAASAVAVLGEFDGFHEIMIGQ
jgi:hypothetical protein